MASKKNKNFSINESIAYGWKHARSKIKFFAILIIIISLVTITPSFLSGIALENNQPGLAFILRIIHWAVQILVALGSINVALRVYDRKKVVYSDLFKNTNLIISFLLASLLYGLIVIVGLILLVVPGIIWSIKYQYYGYFIVDEGAGPIEALKKSAKLTEGVKWKLLFLKFAVGLVNLLGAVCFLVGLLITIPTGMLAEAYVYRKLRGK